MFRKKSATFGLAIAAVALLGACTDSKPVPVAPEAEFRLFGGPENPQLHTGTLDHHLLRTAHEVEGFGGHFFDEAGNLNIYMKGTPALTSGQEERLSAQLASFGVSLASHQSVILEGEYDFVELSEMHSRARHVLSMSGVVYTDIDEGSNRVAIGVENDGTARSVEAALAQLGVPREAVIIRNAEPIHMMQTLRERVRPVAGGLQINFPGFLCTLGFNVRSPEAPNVHGFVTNSHCTSVRGSVTGTPYWQPSGSVPNLTDPNFIGTEMHDLPFFTGGPCPVGRMCRWSDAAGVQYASGIANAFARIYRTTGIGSLTIDPANPMFNIVAEQAFPFLGDVIHKVGRTTGWTSGTVTGSCVNTNVSGTTITLLCQEHVTGPPGSIGSGDSGSPAFHPFPGGQLTNVRLNGIVWGGAGSTLFAFSAMNEIRFENTPPAGLSWRTFPPPPAP